MTSRDSLRRVARLAASRLDSELGRYASIKPYLRDVVPDDLERLDPEAYVPAPVVFGGGVDLREPEQLALLAAWEDRFDSLFAAIRTDPQINTQAPGRPYLHNGQYPTPDAEIYAAMIADRKPSKIVEIGAGYSTRIARRIIDELSLETELVVIDPEPRTDVANYADQIVQKRIEEVELEEAGLDDVTLLFVDSSHVVRAGGDVPVIFCRLIPALASNVLVHVHDVFIPYDYPPAYRWRLYGEAYVLWALLTGASMFRVLFATHFMVRTQLAAMQKMFGKIVGADERYFGASFWFELT